MYRTSGIDAPKSPAIGDLLVPDARPSAAVAVTVRGQFCPIGAASIRLRR
jgi:hypothetical protein